MFTTVIITRPDFFEGETERICQYLQKDFIVHIRKPHSNQEKVEALITQIPMDLYGGIVLHDNFELAVKYGLYGVHLNSRNAEPPAGWSGSVSRSCHSLKEVREWKDRLNYVSLSPVFDSISKQGYNSAFTADEIAGAVSDGTIDNKVYALGGVTFDKLEDIKLMGFGGAMILGDAWK